MRNDVIQRATEYWSERRGGRRLPMRASIDIDALADIRPYLILAEAVDGGRDYLHGIAGAEAEKLLGAAMEGARLSRLSRSDNALAAWRNGLNLARSFKAPHFATFDGAEGAPLVRVVFLPLSRSDEVLDVDFVLAALTPLASDPGADEA